MDKELRELERRAQTDLDSAITLIHRLKKLISDQWGVVLCSKCKGNGSFIRNECCSNCNGEGALRVNITNLSELSSLNQKQRNKPPLKEIKGWLVKAPEGNEGIKNYLVYHLFIKEGQNVRIDEDAIELESDKATLVIPIAMTGTVERIFVKKGQTVEPGDPLYTLLKAD